MILFQEFCGEVISTRNFKCHKRGGRNESLVSLMAASVTTKGAYQIPDLNFRVPHQATMSTTACNTTFCSILGLERLTFWIEVDRKTVEF